MLYIEHEEQLIKNTKSLKFCYDNFNEIKDIIFKNKFSDLLTHTPNDTKRGTLFLIKVLNDICVMNRYLRSSCYTSNIKNNYIEEKLYKLYKLYSEFIKLDILNTPSNISKIPYSISDNEYYTIYKKIYNNQPISNIYFIF